MFTFFSKWVELKRSQFKTHVHNFFKVSWAKGKPVKCARVYIFLKVMLKLHRSNCTPLRQGQLLFPKEIEMTKKEINQNWLSCRGSKHPNWLEYKTPQILFLVRYILTIGTNSLNKFFTHIQIRVRMVVSRKAKIWSVRLSPFSK